LRLEDLLLPLKLVILERKDLELVFEEILLVTDALFLSIKFLLHFLLDIVELFYFVFHSVHFVSFMDNLKI
jgi:hypothetical protein